jgi:hypothetical protein
MEEYGLTWLDMALVWYHGVRYQVGRVMAWMGDERERCPVCGRVSKPTDDSICVPCRSGEGRARANPQSAVCRATRPGR